MPRALASLVAVLALVFGSNDRASMPTLGAEGGAFPLTSNQDAGLILTLPNGVYTLQVTSAGGETGVALAELYELP